MFSVVLTGHYQTLVSFTTLVLGHPIPSRPPNPRTSRSRNNNHRTDSSPFIWLTTLVHPNPLVGVRRSPPTGPLDPEWTCWALRCRGSDVTHESRVRLPFPRPRGHFYPIPRVWDGRKDMMFPSTGWTTSLILSTPFYFLPTHSGCTTVSVSNRPP